LRAIRDAWIVARFDLGESLRSRKAIIFLALYVAGAIGATILFTELLQNIEEQLAEQLLVARTDQPGSLTQAVMESPELHAVLARLVHDDALATALLGLPPVALVYHWIALTFGPAFVALTSSDTISGEVATGSIRYALIRTDRSSWAAGKLIGQGVLLMFGLSLGALGAWVTGYVQLASFDPWASATWLAHYAITAFIFAFAHLGLVMGVSQLTRSVPWSRALGLLSLVLCFGVHGWLSREHVQESAPVLVDSIRQFFPAAHRLDLWRPEWLDVAPGAIALLAIGLTLFTLGHLRLARRDA